MSKPRIRYEKGLWGCTIDGGPDDTGAVGVGDTPQQAFADYLSDLRVCTAQLDALRRRFYRAHAPQPWWKRIFE